MRLSEYGDDELIEELKHRGLKIELIGWYAFMPYKPTQIKIGDIVLELATQHDKK